MGYSVKSNISVLAAYSYLRGKLTEAALAASDTNNIVNNFNMFITHFTETFPQ